MTITPDQITLGMQIRRGWLERECAAARIEGEEMEKARKRIKRRVKQYEREHPLGPEYPPSPDWEIY